MTGSGASAVTGIASRGPVRGPERDRAIAFLRQEGYTRGVDAADQVFIAEVDGELAGVVRLSIEDGVMVLRGMRVRSDLQRKGVGSRLLIRVQDAIKGRVCYCIPFSWLLSFYGTAGFERIPDSEAPAFLSERSERYRQKGLDVTIMRRLPS